MIFVYVKTHLRNLHIICIYVLFSKIKWLITLISDKLVTVETHLYYYALVDIYVEDIGLRYHGRQN